MKGWVMNNQCTKPEVKGWYFVELKTYLGYEECEVRGITESFSDWIYFDGRNWDLSGYEEDGFYVYKVIRSEG